ncbi:hypothetical protein BCR34DRAFT_603866 [Clohesyomyces aquaticus]|uniref:Ankyrin repeat-containing domain protein n=1 Tax=Clohesyomyces aquaticus TaxID=1231657 RepID=A0A1Y1ZBQ9_9PLEO|nr:hypothetical protein BCR34DRAFT_603866 [Clohesyomyces aquaticus]
MSGGEYLAMLDVCPGGLTEIVQDLIDHSVSSDGAVAAAAAGFGHLETVKALLERGADTRGGFITVVEALLDHGADPNEGCFPQLYPPADKEGCFVAGPDKGLSTA